MGTVPDLEYAQTFPLANDLIEGILPEDAFLNDGFDGRDRLCSSSYHPSDAQSDKGIAPFAFHTSRCSI